MAIIVYIKGEDRTSNLGKNSLRIVKGLGNKNSLSLYLNCQASVWLPVVGQDIKIYDDSDLLFGGVIKNIKGNKQEPKKSSDAYVKLVISSNGYESICARRTVNVFYENQTAGYIFTNLVDNILNDSDNNENILKGDITAGNTFPVYSGISKSVKDIFDDIASQSGVQWSIDDSKTISFVQDETVTTADHTIDVTGTFTDYIVMGYESDLQNYCNKVFIKGSSDEVYTFVQDTAEITLRKSAEGSEYSSGVYGKVIEASNVESLTALSTIGDNELKKYGFEPQALSIRSYTSTWTAGTKVQCHLPEFGIDTNTDFMIDQLVIWRESTGILAYDMELSRRKSADFSSQKLEKSKEFFEKLVRSGSGGGLSSGSTGSIKNYQDANSETASITTSLTIVSTKNFNVDQVSDIHMTFTCYLASTAGLTVTANTLLQEDSATSTATYQPATYLSSNSTFTYCEHFEGVSTGDTTISVALATDTGTATIAPSFGVMNLIVFPSTVTATNSANNSLSAIESMTPLVVYDDYPDPYNWINPDNARYESIAIDSSGYIYCGFYGTEDGTVYDWYVYKSEDRGVTWTDLELPPPSSYITTQNQALRAPSLYYSFGTLHVTWMYGHTSTNKDNKRIAYNSYVIADEVWSNPTNSLDVDLASDSIDTFESDDFSSQIVVSTTGKIHIVAVCGTSLTFLYTWHFYSDDDGSTWTNTYLSYRKYPCITLDTDGETIHCGFFSNSSPVNYAVHCSWTLAGGWSAKHSVAYNGGFVDEQVRIRSASNGDLWLVFEDIVGTDSRDFYKSTDNGVNWSKITDIEEGGADFKPFGFAFVSSDSFVVGYIASEGARVKQYTISTDTWGDTYVLPDYAGYNSHRCIHLLGYGGSLYVYYDQQDNLVADDKILTLLKVNL